MGKFTQPVWLRGNSSGFEMLVLSVISWDLFHAFKTFEFSFLLFSQQDVFEILWVTKTVGMPLALSCDWSFSRSSLDLEEFGERLVKHTLVSEIRKIRKACITVTFEFFYLRKLTGQIIIERITSATSTCWWDSIIRLFARIPLDDSGLIPWSLFFPFWQENLSKPPSATVCCKDRVTVLPIARYNP